MAVIYLLCFFFIFFSDIDFYHKKNLFFWSYLVWIVEHHLVVEKLMAHSCQHKYVIILFKIFWWKQICMICQTFAFGYKANKSNLNVSIYHKIIGQHFEDICYILIDNKVFNFFWNVLNTKAINVRRVTTNHMQSYPFSSYWFILIKIYCTYPILYSF